MTSYGVVRTSGSRTHRVDGYTVSVDSTKGKDSTFAARFSLGSGAFRRKTSPPKVRSPRPPQGRKLSSRKRYGLLPHARHHEHQVLRQLTNYQKPENVSLRSLWSAGVVDLERLLT